jgi:hypothetical protein
MTHPNPFGLYDLYGNQLELSCLDVFNGDFYCSSSSPLADLLCETRSTDCTLRGGTHTDWPSFCTSARRWSLSASDLSGAGIRVVCDLEHEP